MKDYNIICENGLEDQCWYLWQAFECLVLAMFYNHKIAKSEEVNKQFQNTFFNAMTCSIGKHDSFQGDRHI